MGDRPADSTARVFLATPASVSPNSWRRSECPTMTYLQPASASWAGATSPVKAPLASQWQFCAETPTGPPRSFSMTGTRATKPGATATSAPETPATASRTPVASATESVMVPNSFQFPQKKGRIDEDIWVFLGLQ